MHIRCRVLIPTLLAAVMALPGVATAQQGQPNPTFCGEGDQALALKLMQGGNLDIPEPEVARPDEGTLNISSVRGMVIHGEGDLVLLRLPGVISGTGNPAPAAPGPSLAVVRLPENCALASFPAGTSVLAVGEPSREGILDATVMGIQPPA
jgi:hypothetical protein